MKNFVLGQYVPGNSYLHKMDPRSKIISTLILMIAVFFLKDFYQMLVAMGIVTIILLSSKLSIIKALRGLKPLLALSIFVFLFQIFFNKSGKIVYSSSLIFSISSIIAIVILTALFILLRQYIKFKFLWLLLYLVLVYLSLIYLDYPSIFYSFTLDIYESGINTSLFVFFRLITIVFIATILTLTTKPTDLTLGIERLLSPLKKIKINPEEIALIISIALRYIPTILDEAYKIMDAQAARGADFKSGSITKRIKILVSLLVPMFVISFERSDELADAMISRNFVPGMPKTRYHELKWKIADTLAIIVSLILLGGSICIYVIM